MSEMPKRRILGLAFISPAMAIVMAMADHRLNAMLVNDDTSVSDVREFIKAQRSGMKREKTLVVSGIRNLRKLGPKPQLVHVVVCDIPAILGELPEVKVGDGRLVDGRWKLESLTPAELVNRIRWSKYSVTIHPKKVAAIRASHIRVLPDHSKKFDPLAALDEILSDLKEDFRPDFESGMYKFLGGFSKRRDFTSLRVKAAARFTGPDSTEALQQFKKKCSTLQKWIEDPEKGRSVTAAYQICCRKPSIKVVAAAERTNASLEVLTRLIRAIPPSKKVDFPGYKADLKKV